MLSGGVIVWNQRLLVYSAVPSGWRAQYLGDDQALVISDALLAAIEADQQHQRDKRLGEAGS